MPDNPEDIVFSFFATPNKMAAETFTLISVGEEHRCYPYSIDRHDGWHTEHIIFTLEGAATAIVNGRRVHCPPGSLLLMPKESSYSYWIEQKHKVWNYLWIEYDGDWARKLTAMLGLQKSYLVPKCINGEIIINRLFATLKAKGNSALYEASAYLWQLLAAAEETQRKTDAPSDYRQKIIEDTISYMQQHLEQPLSVGDLADMVNMSRFHFSRVFKNHTGFSPMKYLQRVRINRARELLRTNSFIIADVAAQVGYPVVQHFSTVFKKEVGLTPGRFQHGSVKNRF